MNEAIGKALRNCNPDQALTPDDEKWVDLDSGRGVSIHKNLVKRLLAQGDDGFAHLALAGHRGCGKSTELKRVMDTAAHQGFLPLYASVTEAVDPNEVSYSDLIRLMSQLLEAQFGNDPRMEKAFSNVYAWYREVLSIDEQTINSALELSGEVGLGGEIRGEAEGSFPGVAKAKLQTGLGKILAFIHWKRRSTKEERTQTREQLERFPQHLLDNLNILLDDANSLLKTDYPRGALFVLDNIDRYKPEMIDQALVRNATLFNEVTAHMIFTVPISLLYNPIEDRIGDRFGMETLPMVPVYARDGQRNENAAQLLSDAVYRRVPSHLFDSDDVVHRLVFLSGGCPRDLLRLLERALIEAEDKITMENAERAISWVRDEYARPLTRSQFGILASVHVNKSIDGNETERMMLFRRQVLEYNGDRWVDAHPLLRETREFKEALNNLRKVH